MNQIKTRVIQREGYIFPIKPTLELFLMWLNKVKEYEYFDKFNYYLFGGFISWPKKTWDVDILITKKDNQKVKLHQLDDLMFYMWNYAYDELGFRIDPMYFRKYQWIADYPRDRKFLKSIEKKTLSITLSWNKPNWKKKFKRYGRINCKYDTSWDCGSKDAKGIIRPGSYCTGDLQHKWVDKKLPLTKLVDLRDIILYYENNNDISMDDFLKKFQTYSGH